MEGIRFFLASKASWIFVIFLIALFGYLIYIWYFFVFNLSWGGENKDDYLRQKDNEVILDVSRLDDILAESQRRRENFSQEIPSIRDIFQIRK